MSSGAAVSLPRDFNAVRQWLDHALSLLSRYSWLSDSYVLDFFVNDHWRHLPSDWQNTLDSWSPHTLAQFLSSPNDGEEEGGDSWPGQSDPPPLSLLAFRASCFCLAFPRAPEIASPTPLLSQFVNHRTVSADTDSQQFKKCYKLSHELRRHVNPKKQHEISRLAALVAELATPIDSLPGYQVIDLGAGQGHLARCLCQRHGLSVLAVDAEMDLSVGAKRCDAQLQAFTRKRASDQASAILPRHVTIRLGGASMISALKEAGVSTDQLAKGVVLVGLHACGRLSEWALRQLVSVSNGAKRVTNVAAADANSACLTTSSVSSASNDSARVGSAPSIGNACCANAHSDCTLCDSTACISWKEAAKVNCHDHEHSSLMSDCWLVLVSCCYMKLARGGDPRRDPAATIDNGGESCVDMKNGWLLPLSCCVRTTTERVSYRVSYTALELSCHALESYRRRLSTEERWQQLRVHAYRAALERVLVARQPRCRHSRVASVKHVERLTFLEYARRALTSHPVVNRELAALTQSLHGQMSSGSIENDLSHPDHDQNRTISPSRPISESVSIPQPISVSITSSQPISGSVPKSQPISESVSTPKPIREPVSTSQPISESVSTPKPISEPDTISGPINDWPSVCWPLSDSEIETASRDVAQWRRVVAFYSLRLLLAPVIESVVLIDRLLYLHENGIQCSAAPLFDPHISPRNFVIVARQPHGRTQ